ncbi:polyadenylate-binding protein 4-like [Stegodyphus dumicola]|uniref:polyadenylate-binding protein 4-like n=1 Tax=Stegodyphus dumicola TaxID=202533 RepID=UPI0015B34DE3|nr:polyadenylate-binding protein 4-like [Stegodyphus dumicola]
MASLYVGNLHPDCTEATLYKKFSVIGKILDIRICRDLTFNKSLGFGFVNYERLEDAEKALDTLNYDLVKGRAIRIMWANKNILKKLPSTANLFVKNLDTSINERILYDIFANYGKIASLKVATDDEGQSKGFAFVQFENEDSANDAIDGLHKTVIHGKKLYVNKFIPHDRRIREKSPVFTNIYLKYLNQSFKDEDLEDLCCKFGTIRCAKIMTDEMGNSKGFGFVNFKDPGSAKKAVEELNGVIVDGQRLYVGRAKKKAERQAEVLKQFKQKLRFGDP